MVPQHKTPIITLSNLLLRTLMEDIMIMMKIRRSTTPPHSSNWKLYENPFYRHPPPDAQVHRLHLPVSARKIAASFWDLDFIDHHRIEELKAEVGRERAARRNSEAANKQLANDLSEERRRRQALERACEELFKEVSAGRAAIGRLRKDIEEERKMLRTAEIIRKESVQMKLAEAKILLEEKLTELETSRKAAGSEHRTNYGRLPFRPPQPDTRAVVKRQNPHIQLGIKGFVEFPTVVRAMGCQNGGKRLGNKLECQKAQLKILLKQKDPVRLLNCNLVN